MAGSPRAIAASILFIVGLVAFRLGDRNASKPIPVAVSKDADSDTTAEQTMAGYATLRRAVGVRWSNKQSSFRVGDVLPAGSLELEAGIAEIDFFCGATVIVEGPAELELESDWSARLVSGRMRATVPPAAQGFVVKAADSEIIDLGTEFALEVGHENVQLNVVDGEVVVRGGAHDGEHLLTGESQSLIGSSIKNDFVGGLSTLSDVREKHELEQQQRYETWQSHSQELRGDKRLIAYYPIVESKRGRLITNAAASGRKLDGTLVGLVNQTRGRFGSNSVGLEFDRAGARVRTRIDGTFEAFTFSCWARIDSLEHVYNSLFMGDGYENGEPHWQIRNDGRLMFSVMVDDSKEVRVPSRVDRKLVKDAGVHRVYFTQPFWDNSKSGQWFHLVAVYDPVGRRVEQYVNGERLSSEKVIDKFYVADLHIGPAEIGNWGQPFRDSPWFAVRNLNGAIDELAIFNAALSKNEIRDLYEHGKPLGY